MLPDVTIWMFAEPPTNELACINERLQKSMIYMERSKVGVRIAIYIRPAYTTTGVI